MLKKLFIAIMLLGVVPGLANAWTITAKIGSAAGSLTCEGRTITSGTSYIAVPDTSPSTVATVTPAAGYKISQVVLDNVNIAQAGVYDYTINWGAKNHTLTVYFTPITYSVTLNQGSGGTLTAQRVLPTTGSISQTGLTGLSFGSTVEITASPGTGNTVTSITSNSTLGTQTHFSGQSTAPVKYRYTVDRDYAFFASYAVTPQVTARVTTSSVHVSTGTPVVLDASGSTTNDPPLSYSWSVIAGDESKVTLTPVSAGSTTAMSFQASAAGDYQLRVTATSPRGGGSFANSSVINVSTPGAFDSEACTSCHSGRDPLITGAYLSSNHATGNVSVSCASCHNSAATLPHPYDNNPTAVCAGCHTSFNAATPGHDSLDSTSGCATCHDPHSGLPSRFSGAPHFNNLTSGAYPASYASSRSACSDCHRSTSGPSLDAVRKSWAGSGHGDVQGTGWKAEDFKTQNECVRCHTRTGFVAYSSFKVTSAWGSASDKTKEVLNCNGCHKQDFSLRAMLPYSSATAFSFRVDADNTVSVPYKNLDYGTSNLCITCHGGTTNGEIIKLAFGFANFTAAGRLKNHFMVGAGVMDNSIGYEFDGTPAGRNLDFNKQNTWHSGIGLPNERYNTGTSGPCATCHMSTPGDAHSYRAVFKNQTGSVLQVTASEVCVKCHPSSLGGGEVMTPAALNRHRLDFLSAIAALKGVLQAKGLDPDAPAGIVSWGGSSLVRANNMGAYYNYLLLSRNDVAAYVHNPVYARRLIQYSIDWLDNALFDDSCYTSIDMLPLQQATKDAAVSYLGVSFTGITPNCYSCHATYYN